MGGKRAKPVYGASAYIKGDLEINAWRSGINSTCEKCGVAPGTWCKSKKGDRMLMYAHPCRRAAGKATADQIVDARRSA